MTPEVRALLKNIETHEVRCKALEEALRQCRDAIVALEDTPMDYGIVMELQAAMKAAEALLGRE